MAPAALVAVVVLAALRVEVAPVPAAAVVHQQVLPAVLPAVHPAVLPAAVAQAVASVVAQVAAAGRALEVEHRAHSVAPVVPRVVVARASARSAKSLIRCRLRRPVGSASARATARPYACPAAHR